MKIAHITSSLVAAASLAASPLPPPEFYPTGPSGVASPGGAGLPEMSGSKAQEGPEIAMGSEMVRPGETFVASGVHLSNARLHVWSESGLRIVEPLLARGDRMAAALPGDLVESAFLIWPERDGQVGSPFRVNTATTWWVWPRLVSTDSPAQTVKLMGKNLNVPSAEPVVYLRGSSFDGFVEIVDANPYRLELKLPELDQGEYQLWAHNGTGGDFGWSQPMPLIVEENAGADGGTGVEVSEFGALPDDGNDDSEAIRRGIEHLKQSGGGTLRFPPGRFLVESPVKIDGAGIMFEGVGAGGGVHGEGADSEAHTTLTYNVEKGPLSELLIVAAPGVSLKGLNLVNGHDGNDQNTVAVLAEGSRFKDIRVELLDRRDWGFSEPGPWGSPGERRGSGPYDLGYIDDGAILVDTQGQANFEIRDSEIHATGPGIQIGRFSGWDTMVSQYPSKSIWISNVAFRGHYAGEPDGESKAGASGRATGVVIYSGKEVAVENSSFQSVDRENRRVMGRSVLVFNTSSRDLYFGNNESLNTGSHPSAVGMDQNQGEQYLIHYRYPYGGLFNVESATNDSLDVSTANIEPFPVDRDPDARWDLRLPHFHFDSRGSQVPSEVGEGGNWILFVSAGKGAGQFREIDTRESSGTEHRFTLREPWRVVPDETIRVNLMPAYRHIVLYRNLVDTGKLIESHKSHGVTFWFDSFDNVVDGNTFRNLTSGIIINSRFRGPTGWNTSRDNLMENIAGYTGDTSEKPAGYVDHTRLVVQWPKPEDRVWYQVGNAGRGNTIRNSEVGMYLHTRYTGLTRYQKPPVVDHPDGGIVLSVIENNRIENVMEGIVVSSPVNAAVIRDNVIESKGMTLPPILNQDAPEAVIDSVLVGNRFNGRTVDELVTVKRTPEASPTAAVATDSGSVDPLPPPDERTARLILRQGSLEIPGGMADPAYQAPAATIRSHLPGMAPESPGMFIGTHEAGSIVQANRGLFSFSLAPLADYLAREGGRVEKVYLVLTTATPNPEFPGSSSFRVHGGGSFNENLADWHDQGGAAESGGMVGDHLATAIVTHAHAATTGSPIIFTGKNLKGAVESALLESTGQIDLLVKRGEEDVPRVANYYFRPADNSHRHSSGHLEWRPALVVDITK